MISTLLVTHPVAMFAVLLLVAVFAVSYGSIAADLLDIYWQPKADCSEYDSIHGGCN